MNLWQKFVTRLVEFARGILAILDWLVMVAERMIVLGVTFLALYFGVQSLRGLLTDGQSKALYLAGQSWRIVFILMIPLFYQTVRTFLEEVQEIWGMKRPKQARNSSITLPDVGTVTDVTETTLTTEEE
jgi:hypothetical protein